MKVSRRELILIVVALLLLGFAIWYKSGLGIVVSNQSVTNEPLLTKRLRQAQAIIQREKTIRRQSVELAQLKRNYIRHSNPEEWILAATGDLARVAASVGIRPEIIKPGMLKNEGWLSAIPFQLKVTASIPELMDLMAAFRAQLPAVRVMRLTIVPSRDGQCTVDVSLDYLFPELKSPKIVRLKGNQPSVSAGTSLRFLKDRLSGSAGDWQQDWTRLIRAFGFQAIENSSETDDGTIGYSYGPRLLGIVYRGDQAEALIQLGEEAWYLAPGEIKGSIQLMVIGDKEVTLRYQGRIIKIGF